MLSEDQEKAIAVGASGNPVILGPVGSGSEGVKEGDGLGRRGELELGRWHGRRYMGRR